MTGQAAAKANELKGRVKEAAGKAKGDRGLELRGKGEQVKAHAAGATANVKKAARKAKDAVTR